jgi:hypothetical protein
MLNNNKKIAFKHFQQIQCINIKRCERLLIKLVNIKFFKLIRTEV